MKVAIAGGGVFGVTAALALRLRGHEVVLVDPGPLPHPDAASTDVSKLIRMDYGGDAFYTSLMEACFSGWERWNAEWRRPLYHETGMLVMSREPMRPGTFEGDSFALLEDRGVALRRLDGSDISNDFPFRGYSDAYLNPRAGWAESGAVTAALVQRAVDAGVEIMEAAVLGLLGEDRVAGVRTPLGDVRAECVVVAMGAWTPTVLPELADRISAVGQPVLHFRVDPDLFGVRARLPWAADIANTGWYGFPALPDGTLKIANHGPGIPCDPRGPREVPPHWEERFRSFFRANLPALANAPCIGSRLCLYADTFDGDFFMGRHPSRQGLVVSTGGSGHGFKFAPILGSLTADAVEDIPNPHLARFRWRPRGAHRTEWARNT